MSAAGGLTVAFRFAVGQSVYISGTNTGLVVGRADYGTHQQYRVVYWANGVRYVVWLDDAELA